MLTWLRETYNEDVADAIASVGNYERGWLSMIESVSQAKPTLAQLTDVLTRMGENINYEIDGLSTMDAFIRTKRRDNLLARLGVVERALGALASYQKYQADIEREQEEQRLEDERRGREEDEPINVPIVRILRMNDSTLDANWIIARLTDEDQKRNLERALNFPVLTPRLFSAWASKNSCSDVKAILDSVGAQANICGDPAEALARQFQSFFGSKKK